ncbi:MAG: putative toxin-antitoxin system toxin component, PIN family [Gemmatimonadetes bacterium]|nr:putative toxin-antitoxin system toxin component, PIN family [Gemmatimonadota bacterium]NNM06731.1 putative toxin-antitoxin system toxin component, PIN family [Gemmatimonadota bacterium]
MNVVLDTNVFVSGVFFSGVPGKILETWRDGGITLVTSPKILDEYRRVGDFLSARYEGVDLQPFLSLAATAGLVVEDIELPEQICEDPDDDKFLVCALASGAKIVVSGDKHLLRATGWRGIDVLTPRKFCDGYLR